eukprot:362226-Chlamydomonas_euryale.AAC.1
MGVPPCLPRTQLRRRHVPIFSGAPWAGRGFREARAELPVYPKTFFGGNQMFHLADAPPGGCATWQTRQLADAPPGRRAN